MKMSIRGIQAAKRSLSTGTKAVIKDGVQRESLLLFKELINATPVDTGEAKESWRYNAASYDSAVISNSAEHIAHLNDGSSAQAPEYFIERTALRYGTAKGVIVEKRGR